MTADNHRAFSSKGKKAIDWIPSSRGRVFLLGNKVETTRNCIVIPAVLGRLLTHSSLAVPGMAGEQLLRRHDTIGSWRMGTGTMGEVTRLHAVVERLVRRDSIIEPVERNKVRVHMCDSQEKRKRVPSGRRAIYADSQ
jgi:hypothetical protein